MLEAALTDYQCNICHELYQNIYSCHHADAKLVQDPAGAVSNEALGLLQPPDSYAFAEFGVRHLFPNSVSDTYFHIVQLSV